MKVEVPGLRFEQLGVLELTARGGDDRVARLELVLALDDEVGPGALDPLRVGDDCLGALELVVASRFPPEAAILPGPGAVA